MRKHRLFNFLMILMLCLGSFGGLAGSSSAAGPQAEEPTSDFVVARIYFADRAELDMLASQLDVWEVNHAEGYLVAMLSTERYDQLSQAGYILEIDQAKTDQANQPLVPLPGQGPDQIPGYPCYRTVEENYLDMPAMEANYPDLVDLTDIGDSWEKVQDNGNGYDMLMLRLTNENLPVKYGRFFLMASTHARELVTTETAMRMAEYLLSQYGIDPDITWMLDYFEIYMVPVANPDGRIEAEDGDWWRKNTDDDDGCSIYNPDYGYGTDLNRNNGFHWGGASTDPCSITYQGPAANSEPENQAIQAQVLALFPDQRGSGDTDPAPADTTGLFITLHSYSELVLWPWGWTSTDAPNHVQLQTLGRKMAYFNDYEPQQANDLYGTTGTHDDWAYGILGIAGYTFEMGTTFFQDCTSFENTIYPDNLDALLNSIKAARRPYMTPAGPVSLNLAAMPIAIAPGDPITITATANDTRYSNNNGTEPSQNIAEACYSINVPSFVTGTITYPMSASDGSFNSTIENIEATIDTSSWTNGRYTIFVESKDAAGNWGYVSAVFVDVIDPNVAPHITGYVYDATSNDPLQATISTGGYQTTSDPVTGFYEMVVLSGTYDITASAENYVPVTVTGVVAEDNQTVEQDFYLSPLCDAFFDDVEGGNLGWTAQSPWAITDESSNSPSHSWTDSPGGNYGNNKNISLTSQSFDLTDWENLALRFWHTYETQATYDNAIVEYSTDNGSTWTEIVRYSGIMETWTEVELDLTALDGIATAMIRFRLSTNNYLYNDGWHIDDIELFGSSPYCGAPESPTAEFSSNSPVDLGNPVAFTNESTGTPTLTYLWDFGDGIGTSTEKNPSYTYAAADTYTVTLTATNDYGSDEVTHPVVVQSVPLTGVDLSLAITGTIYVGDVVDFSADLMPDDASKPYTYTIDLGDGSPIMDGTSNLDPLPFTHTYAVTGTFTVLIEAWNEGMGEPVTDSLDINVYDVGVCVPLTGISIEGAAEGTPGVYTFTSTYEPSDASLPVSYLWDNDDETAVSVRTLDVGVHVLTVSAGNCETVEVSGTHTITISEAGESFSTFLPLVTKTGIVQGMTNQIQKGMADDTPAMSFMVLPVLFSAMFSLPVMKKLR